ncbi:MAG: NAD-dependent epimerase/dehydratase family protein, partial [Acidimicrobiaceae bacterium]|nr:NAD-dependent epimerase/dehydratase family protein [Acidimicrobiaceae bacterium]
MKALITGSSGFVGGHLVEHLRSVGDEVCVLDPAVDIRDRQALSLACSSFMEGQVDVIFHLAAMSHVGDSFGSSAEVFKVNVMGSVNLLEVARAQFPRAK